MLLINEANWCDDIAKYLTGTEPKDPAKAKCLRHRARKYCIIKSLLYKGGVCAPLLRCAEGQSLLRDIQEAPCGAH